MAKESYYFSHDYNARSDKNIIKLRMKHNMQGLGIYWCIIEMLYEEGGYLLLSEYERITFELHINIELLNSIIDDFNLFQKDNDKFWSNSVIKRLKIREDKRQKAKDSINSRWNKNKEKYDLDTNVLPMYYEGNTIKERKGKEIKEKEIKRAISFCENKEYAIFENGEKQKLGLDQIGRLAAKDLKPYDVVLGLIN